VTLDAIADLLWCPRCHGTLARIGAQLGCGSGHRFDIARQGYVNLLGRPQPANADSSAMIEDRLALQETGAFGPVLTVLRSISTQAAGFDAAVIVDAGAGPGWYLAGLLDGLPTARGVALDVSVAACRRAARAHPRLGAVVADTWRELPVQSSRADLVLSIFAPRNHAEFARLIRPGGRVVIVSAGVDHLAELRSEFGLLGIGTGERVGSSGLGLRRAQPTSELRWQATLSGPDVARVIMMGPNAFHRDRPADDGVDRRVTLHVMIDVLARDSASR